MKHLRVVDQAGNQTDYETDVVPRIGELIMLRYGIGGEPVRDHFFRVKDVLYRLENKPEHHAAILLGEEIEDPQWPS